MDGTTISTLFDFIPLKGMVFLHTLLLIWIVYKQNAHEKHCRHRHEKHYEAAEKLTDRVSRLEGALHD